MDTKDIWEEFKDRINSPFFGSFIISWLLWNWRIPVVLLFYKHEELIKTNTSFIDVLNRFTDPWISVVLPLLFAGVYTYAYPYVRRIIKIHIAKVDFKTDEAIYKHTDKTTIPVSVFRQTKTDLKANEAELAELITQEGQTKKLNESLQHDLKKYLNEISLLKNDHLQEISVIRAEELKTLADQRRGHEERLSRIELENSSRLNEMQNIYDVQIDTLKKELSDRNVAYKTAISEKDSEIASLRIDRDESLIRISSLEHEVNNAEREAARLNENTLVLNHQLVQAGDDLASKENEISSLKISHIKDIEEATLSLKEALKEKESAVSYLDNELYHAQRDTEYWRLENEATNKKFEEYKEEYLVMSKSIGAWRTKLSTLRDEIGGISELSNRIGSNNHIPSEQFGKIIRYMEITQNEFPDI